MRIQILTGCIVLLFSIACAEENERASRNSGTDSDTDSDADSDADSDNDADADSDSDTDSDTDADSDTDTDTDTDTDSDSDSDSDTNSGDDGCTAMDILFVIDDSGSMVEEQSNLVDNFPKFIQVLDNYKTPAGTHPYYRIGVTSSGVNRTFKRKEYGSSFELPDSSSGADGVLLGKNTCGLADSWIDGPGSNVSTDFGCTANVGTSGDGTEMPLAAIEEALGKQMATGMPNADFYRHDEESLLVVVIITDEDDCSIDNGGTLVVSHDGASDCKETSSIGLYSAIRIKEFLDNLTGGPGRYVVLTIAGLTSCNTAFGDAAKARRLLQFNDLFGEFAVFGDICSGDLWKSLEETVELMKITCDDMVPVV
jgi:hypothetical protein